MCLAVPMRLVSLEGRERGRAELDGTYQRVDLSLIEEPRVDDYVIVHAGFAIAKLDAEEAEARLELFARFAVLQSGDGEA